MQDVEQAEQVIESPEKADPTPQPFALLFELEHVATRGRKAVFSLLSSILGDNDIKLTALQFSKSCARSSTAELLDSLLEEVGAKKLSVEKLEEDLDSGIAMSLSSSEAALDPGFEQVLSAASDRNVLIAAVSSLPENTAQAVMSRLGLDEKGISLCAYDGAGHSYPRADIWLKISKGLGRSPRNCVAFVSSAASSRSALSAGMRCVSVPDEFTAFQDFGGSDLVLDTYEDLDAGEMFDTLFPDHQTP